MNSFNKNALLYSICFMLFLDSVGVGIIFPILPQLFFNSSMGLISNDLWISRANLYSIALAIFPLMAIFGMPLLGVLSDKYGRKKVILIGVAALTSNYFLSAVAILSHNLWLFMFSRLVGGFLTGIYAVGNALVSNLSTSNMERISNFKRTVLADKMGLFLGPSLSMFVGVVAFMNPLASPFCIATILGLCSFSLLLYNFRNIPDNVVGVTAKHDRTIRLSELFHSVYYVFHRKNTRLLGFAFLFFQFGAGLFIQALSLYLTVYYSYTPAQISRFSILMTLCTIISLYFLSKLAYKYFTYKVQIKVSIILISVIFIWIFVASNILPHKPIIDRLTGVWITSAFFYMMVPFIRLAFVALFASSVDSTRQGLIMGTVGQLTFVAWFLTGLIVGEVVHSKLVLASSAVFFCISGVLLYRYLHLYKK